MAKALNEATPGSVVRIGDCIISGGSFNVPAGITVTGAGRGKTFVEVAEGATGFTLNAGDTATTLTNLTIVTDGRFGARVVGAGAAAIRSVTVVATRGVGIGAEGTTTLDLAQVNAIGPINGTTANTIPFDATALTTATHGVALVNVGTANINTLTTSGFAQFGTLLINSGTSWVNGGGTNNRTDGVMIYGGTADLASVVVSSTRRGGAPFGQYPAGFVFANGAQVTTNSLRSSANEGFGVFADTAGATSHSGIVLSSNAQAGLWAQASAALAVSGLNLTGNGFGGIVAIDTESATLTNVTVKGTRLTTLEGIATAGDGIELVGTPGTLSTVSLQDNAGAGFIADLSPYQTLDSLSFTAVSVSSKLTASLGVIAQQGTSTLPLITAGVTRTSALLNADSAWVAGGTVSPVAEPSPDPYLPAAQLIETGGLDAVFGSGLI